MGVERNEGMVVERKVGMGKRGRKEWWQEGREGRR
jgi:hypothetical protein